MRVAAIDIGSNSIRLLVADLSDGGAPETLATVARAGEPCRLGRGLDRTGAVEVSLAERAALLVTEFRRRAQTLGATRVVVAATAALRNATNGREIADRIGAAAGQPVRILSGDEEAQLVYHAVVAGLGELARRSSCVVFDLGGGSTEIVSGVGLAPGRWVSLPVGAVNMTERHLAHDPPTPEELAALTADVEQNLMHECAYMPAATGLLAGVGGTITALAMLDRGVTSYQPEALEGWTIPTPRFLELSDRLVHSTEAERRALTVIGEGRADILAAGTAVVRSVLKRFSATGLTCSTQGLRYGLARLAAAEAIGDVRLEPR